MDSVEFQHAHTPVASPGLADHAVIKFENTGGTPAFNVTFNATLKFTRTVLPDDFGYPETPNNAQTSGPNNHGIVGPRVPEAFTLGIPAQALESLKSGTVQLYVYGHISYDDVFNKRHTTLYCAYLNGPEDAFSLCATHYLQYDGNYKPLY